MPGKQACVLVGAAQHPPGVCRSAPVTRDFQCVRLRDIRRSLAEGAGTPQPGCQLAVHPRIATSVREFIHRLDLANDAPGIACQPRGFRAYHGKHAGSLQLGFRTGQSARFLHRPAGIRIAAAHSQVCQGPQCRNTRDGRGARVPQHRFHILTRSVPVALLEPHARSVREYVRLAEVQIALFTVPEPRAQIPGRLLVLTARDCHGSRAIAQPQIPAANSVPWHPGSCRRWLPAPASHPPARIADFG